MGKLVSVILTTYKRPVETVRRAIDSVVNQSYRPLELIVVNDNPEDGDLAEDIAGELAEFRQKIPIQYLLMEHNAGACAARNRGAQYSRGEFLAFLDDDDVWVRDKIKWQMDYIGKNDVVLVTGLINFVSGDKEWMYNSRQRFSGTVLHEILCGNYVGGCSVPLLSKRAFEQVRGFDTRYRSSQDLNLWIRLAKTGKFGFVDRILLNYSVGEDGITADTGGRLQGWELLLSDFRDEYQNDRRAKQRFLLMIAGEMHKAGEEELEKKYREEARRAGGLSAAYMRARVRLYIPSFIVEGMRRLRKMAES